MRRALLAALVAASAVALPTGAAQAAGPSHAKAKRYAHRTYINRR
jgi:hypothetical protein